MGDTGWANNSPHAHDVPPILISFPIAFLAAAIITDILYYLTRATMWANASLWLLGGCVVVVPFAAMAGFAASARRRGIQTDLSWQQLGFLSAVGLVMLDWFPRYKYGTAFGFPPFGILVSLSSLGILAMSVKLGSGALALSAKDSTVTPAAERSSILDEAIPGR